MTLIGPKKLISPKRVARFTASQSMMLASAAGFAVMPAPAGNQIILIEKVIAEFTAGGTTFSSPNPPSGPTPKFTYGVKAGPVACSAFGGSVVTGLANKIAIIHNIAGNLETIAASLGQPIWFATGSSSWTGGAAGASLQFTIFYVLETLQ